jgi:hypothetical protein
MHRNSRWTVLSLVLGVVAFVGFASVAHAQGITGSAVTGTVTGEGVGTLEGAEVQLRNPETGEVFSGVSNASGRFFIDNVTAGGPYTLTARFEGYPLNTQSGIQLTLGQRLNIDVAMKFQVEEIVIHEEIDPLQDHGRTGSQTTVKARQINQVPLQGRNFTDLVSTAPQASGNSIAGQNNRFNNIQIDGGANNDLFGLAGNGTPGGQAGAKPLSLEAIKEFVIQIAPFDVRQGSFVGGLVNAVTKSGTNEFHGTAFTYYQAKALAGNQDDPTFNGFHTLQYGASVGGPIIKDVLHFFIAADLQDRSSSFGNQFQIGGVDNAADLAKAGFTADDAKRFASILSTKYGVNNVGDALAPELGNPDRNVFAKLSWNINETNHLEFSYNLVSASSDILTRAYSSTRVPSATGQGTGLRDGYELSNSGYTQVALANTGRLKLTSRFGEISNELLASFSILRDHRDMPQTLPLILVAVGKVGSTQAWLAAGGERFSHQNLLDQNIFQVQDNVTIPIGDHRLTFGTSNEFLNLKNVFWQAAYGAWAFNSLDDLQAANATAFTRYLQGSNLQDGGTAAFTVAQLGVYVQDEWQLAKNLNITPGIRLDLPILGGAVTNPSLVNNAAFPIDTGKIPTLNPLISPRVGFNYDIEGNSESILRGGAGLFAGRPPYVWVSNSYSGNGLALLPITCVGKNTPAFTVDPNNQPSMCTGAAPPAPEIDYFDPGTKYPQNFQAALGFDKRLPYGFLGTIDLLYTHEVNGWYTSDENLENTGQNGEGRATYGTVNPSTGSWTPTRVDPKNVGPAIKVYNKSEGRVYNAAFSISKKIDKYLDLAVGYAYSDSQDLISLTSSQALSNYQFEPLDGTIEQRNLRPSAFDRTHKITVTATADLPYGFNAGLTYVGQSGTPYTWVVNGDVNGDGQFSNDPVFVPATKDQITLSDPTQWDALNSFISSQDCLNNARGRLIQRGECRNPWSNFVNLRLGWGWKTFDGQRLDLQFDIFNLMNLLNSDWGLFKSAASFETANTQFLTPAGYDTMNNRPVYTFKAPTVVESTIFSPTSSRWRMQLGLRYTF